ncbi:MAG TPA: hypothetical protein VF527_20235, partial [Pyrinomonadaceae bacterium]
MRKSLLLGLLGLVLAAASMIPLTKSGAVAHASPPQKGNAGKSHSKTLPDYDIRLVGRSEFMDYDLNSPADAAARGVSQNSALRARATAIEKFRASLASEHTDNLRAVANDTGAIKNIFIDGAPLGTPQTGAPDTIARGFLKQHDAIFALDEAAVAKLKLDREDNDEGTSFLRYVQTVGGIKVFEGDVQVAVNREGEVLSVREGFLISGQQVGFEPVLDEAQGIARAFEHAGRTVMPSFAETFARSSKSERSAFANPLSANNEEVLSELNILRVGDEARLAWHVFADIGANEWYELLVDAESGELLYRRNLYVFEAQGTVYTEHPSANPTRQLVSFVGNTTINTAAGWMGTSTVTTGNNAEAYLDTNADNIPDSNNTTGLSNG